MDAECVAIIISIVALVLSTAISGFATKVSIDANKASKSQLEMQIRSIVSEAGKNVVEREDIYINTKEEVNKLVMWDAVLAAREAFLNVYDHACELYLEGKLDSARFKKIYKYEILALIDKGYYGEDAPYKEHYKGEKNGRYKATWKVYYDWKHNSQKH